MRGNTSFKLPAARRKKILRDLFPNTTNKPRRIIPEASTPEPFTEEELRQAIKGIKNGKAPGPDGLTVEALKLAFEIIPEKLLAKFNDLLKKQDFPDTWKTARVVLLAALHSPAAGKGW